MARLLARFRWPIAFGIVALLFLVYLLQPRPMAEYRLPRDYASVIISPSGSLLAAYHSEAVDLYQLPTMELLKTHQWNEGFSVAFDADDNLVFATYKSSEQTPEGATLQLWHWQQGDPSPRIVASKKPFPPDHPHAGHSGLDGFNGLWELNSRFLTHCILSPDARQWLIPVTDGTHVRFELVDSRTGNSLRLDIPIVDLKNPSIGNLAATFNVDSNELITWCSSPSKDDDDYKSSHLFRWFDLRTGKILHSKVIQSPDRFNHLGQVCLIERKRVIGLDQESNELIMQLHSDASGHQSIVMNETLANPAEQPWPKPTDSLWVAYPDYGSQLDTSKNLLIYWWEHHLFPKQGGLGGRAPNIPGFYYGVRDINTGKLLHTQRLPDRSRKPDDWDDEGWSLFGILPDTVLIFKQSRLQPHPWQQKYEEWRAKHVPWLFSLPMKPLRLLFVEATTGKRVSELSKPFTSVIHQFHQKEQALYLIGSKNDQTTIQKYAYPLRKPWLMILSWSLGIVASLVCLQTLTQLLRPKRKVGPEYEPRALAVRSAS